MLASALLCLNLLACGFVDDSSGGGAAGADGQAALSADGTPAVPKGTIIVDGVVVADAAADGKSGQAPGAAGSSVAPAGAASSQSIYKVQTLIDDMRLPNERGWWQTVNGDMTADKNGPDKGAGQTWAYVMNGLRAADAQSHWPKKYLDSSFGLSGDTPVRRLGWFVIGRAAQAQPKAKNARAQTRNFKNFVLYRNGKWVEASSNNIGVPYPANWHENFVPGNEQTQSIVTGGGLDQARTESSGGASVGSIGYGNRTTWVLHAWPADNTLPQSTWVNDVVGAVTVFEARLIVHDQNQPDDRADANLLVAVGADWYGPGQYYGEHSHGRLRLLTNDWNIYSSTDIPEAVLRANPPPGYSN